METLPEILPCPFCGGADAATMCQANGWIVQCVKAAGGFDFCGARSRHYSTKEEAIQGWNRRSPLLDEEDANQVVNLDELLTKLVTRFDLTTHERLAARDIILRSFGLDPKPPTIIFRRAE